MFLAVCSPKTGKRLTMQEMLKRTREASLGAGLPDVAVVYIATNYPSSQVVRGLRRSIESLRRAVGGGTAQVVPRRRWRSSSDGCNDCYRVASASSSSASHAAAIASPPPWLLATPPVARHRTRPSRSSRKQ